MSQAQKGCGPGPGAPADLHAHRTGACALGAPAGGRGPTRTGGLRLGRPAVRRRRRRSDGRIRDAAGGGRRRGIAGPVDPPRDGGWPDLQWRRDRLPANSGSPGPAHLWQRPWLSVRQGSARVAGDGWHRRRLERLVPGDRRARGGQRSIQALRPSGRRGRQPRSVRLPGREQQQVAVMWTLALSASCVGCFEDDLGAIDQGQVPTRPGHPTPLPRGCAAR